jgi:hypothetical protein
LNTGDSQDRKIIDNSSVLVPATRGIAAWGDSLAPSYHGTNNNARSAVRFMGAASGEELVLFQPAMEAEAKGNFEIKAKNFAIPADTDTTYERLCFSKADLTAMGVTLDQDLHTIIDPLTSKCLHHFLVHASEQPWNPVWPCQFSPAYELAYLWGPGSLPQQLPPNVGAPLGSTGF